MQDPTAPFAAQLTKAVNRVDLREFAGGIPQEKATLPQIRIGKKWFTTAQILTVLVPLGYVGGLAAVAFCQWLRTIPEVQAFIVQYPGTGSFAQPVESGFPWWLRCQHFLNFFLIHVTMVFSTGLLENLNHITRGANDSSPWGLAIFLGLISVAVILWVIASPLTLRYPRLVQYMARYVVGGPKAVMEKLKPVAQFKEKDCSPHFWPNGTLPVSGEYQQLKAGGFRDYKLKVGGLVQVPKELPYDELKALGKQAQITQHYCIQGWSGVAKWTGVPMSTIMDLVRPKPEARFVVFYSFAHGAGEGEGLYYDVHKIEHMSHENTILALEMNGQPLPELHGAPLRLRNELELGFKQVKWIQAIEFVSDFRHLGAGQGGFNEDHEYYGYRAPV